MLPTDFEPYYQQALIQAAIGLWIYDVKNQRFSWDEGSKRLFETDFDGCSLEEAFKFVHNEDEEMARRFVKDALDEKIEVDTFFKVRTSRNTTKYLKARGFKVKENSELIRFYGLSWDVTNESILQIDLKKEKKFTENILNSIPDPIFVKNRRHQLIYANTEYEKFVGMPKDKFIGKTDDDFFPKDVADIFREKNEKVFLDNQPTEIEEQVQDCNLRLRDVMTKKTPLTLPGNEQMLVGVIRDITDLKSMQHSLIEQSKMASLGEMAAGIGHEINNPLTIIQGKAQLIQEKLKLNSQSVENLQKDLELIEQNCNRIDKIIKSLKSVSRKADQDPFETFSLLKAIDEAYEISKERFRKHKLNLFVITAVDIDYSLKSWGRPSEIVQVLVNLLNNSYDAIQSQSSGWARIQMSASEKQLLVEITDSGAEIPPEVESHMMEPFFTTKSTGKGTGLGLSVSRQIIQHHKGELYYDRNHPHTRFVFTLPRV